MPPVVIGARQIVTDLEVPFCSKSLVQVLPFASDTPVITPAPAASIVTTAKSVLPTVIEAAKLAEV